MNYFLPNRTTVGYRNLILIANFAMLVFFLLCYFFSVEDFPEETGYYIHAVIIPISLLSLLQSNFFRHFGFLSTGAAGLVLSLQLCQAYGLAKASWDLIKEGKGTHDIYLNYSDNVWNAIFIVGLFVVEFLILFPLADLLAEQSIRNVPEHKRIKSYDEVQQDIKQSMGMIG
ncbi:hypothetical protein PCE1_000534 [Barthelona sp. PCE]